MIDDEHLWDIACGEPGPPTWAATRGASIIRFFRFYYVYSVLYIGGVEHRFTEPGLRQTPMSGDSEPLKLSC